MAERFRVNEIFWSPQGEGMRAGEMSLFIRFTGCNLKCAVEAGPKSIGGFDCDTEFESGRWLDTGELIAEAKATIREGMGREPFDGFMPWIVLTGGEPALQVTPDLCNALKDNGFRLAIETNGSIDLGECENLIDWITVSPKVAEHAIKQKLASEVKYVRGYGQALPKTVVAASNYLISPAFNGLLTDKRVVDWCIKLVAENPTWRLSPQHHKLWLAR